MCTGNCLMSPAENSSAETEADAAPRVRGLLLALLGSGVGGLLFGMMLPASTMTAWSAAIGPLSRSLGWLENFAPPLDLVHVLLFAWITLCLRWVFPRLRAWQVALVALALAAGSEILQLMAPGRGPGLFDVGQDLLGISLGLVIGWLLRAMRRPALARALRSVAGYLLLAGALALPWMRWHAGSLLAHDLLVADLLLAAALGLRLLGVAAGDSLRLTRLHAWLALYVGLMALAVLAQVTSLQFYSGAAKWIGVLYLALLAMLVHDLARTKEYLRRLAMTWLAATAAVSALVLLAAAGFWLSPSLRAAVEPLLFHDGFLPVGNTPRVMASFANPDMLCSYLIVGLALTLAARSLGWLSPRLGTALAGIVTLAAVFTFSPGWAGIAVVWSLWAWRVLRVGRPGLAAAALTAGLAAAALVLVACVVNSVDLFGAPGLRWGIWEAALQTVLAHPWLGVGVGQAVVEVFHLAPNGGLQKLTDAHNIWLNVAGQAGVLAAFALAGLLAHLARKPVVPRQEPVATLRFALVLVVIGAWIFAGLTSSLEDARHAWLLLGLLATCRSALVQESAASPDPCK